MIIASLLSPEAEDSLATFIALFVIFVVPAVLIALFWMVHILPEQIAHKRNHPQFEAIRTLCLLSLVFGGLLWPIAWLWAYSKPVMHKMAYGTDKLHPDERRTQPRPSASTIGSRASRRRACPRPTCRRFAPTSTRSRPSSPTMERRNGNHPPRHLLLLRLADLHQAQAAAVDHAVEGRGVRSFQWSRSRRCCCC